MRIKNKILYFINRIKVKFFHLLKAKNNDYLHRFKNNYETFISTIEHKSFIRFGDGEAVIMMGGDIYFQKYNKKLANDLKTCMQTDRLVKCYHPCIFKKPISKNWENLYYYFEKYEKTDTVFDAIYLRINSSKGFDNKLFYRLTLFFKMLQKYEIVLVHNDEQNRFYLEEILKKEVSFVKIASKNAYEKKNEILKSIINRVKNINNTRILISAGPTAKVLVKELSDMGYIAYDVGHIPYKEYYCKKN